MTEYVKGERGGEIGRERGHFLLSNRKKRLPLFPFPALSLVRFFFTKRAVQWMNGKSSSSCL